MEQFVGLSGREAELPADVGIVFAGQPRSNQRGGRGTQLVEALAERLHPLVLEQVIVIMSDPAIWYDLRVGKSFGLPLLAMIDERMARDLIEPGAEVATVELFREMMPGPPPDLLVQVLAVGGPGPRGDESKE